ncbi:aminomethyl-transferring glycine dehydrogenase subunit GcvPA [Oligosphaera ethanolica]|uniref:Probable glycine dehydrogenase (decarboxylating) subunit 1 n=1 Tax=Oligosphaera ethanolica TaxID=760260 RepID=A0AAE3VDK8_9BACT|nr:aminomethyl-transferring glycine dehydrogenase subunit GcvPA [Oligosphaera ethanolica]MDQ0288436.1 glycine dehydrogenase subunit 1 [Oligosphaera ethanolica]
MPFIANTDADRREMLAAIGCASLDQLWDKANVPAPTSDFSMLPSGRSEYEVAKHLTHLAGKNATELVCFLGMGYYDHFIPAAVSEILGRSGFYTAYTPYQAEASQGTLQAIFEWQTAICRLTGMDVANASLYDGGTAVFEAMVMALRSTQRRHVVLASAVSPIFREMLKCYSANLDCRITTVATDDERSNQDALLAAVDDDTACVIVQYPNAFGTIEDWTACVAAIKARGALAVCASYPTALAVVKTPGECGFDIVVGEGQPLGMPLSFGGPYLGFMCTTSKLMRKMPGRIVGQAKDASGRTGYVLTLQAREQHIRRAQAMSNICSNENLCALCALSYMTLMGKQGLVEVAELCMSKARYALDVLSSIRGVRRVGSQPFFNEFVVELPVDAAEASGRMVEKGYAAGFPLGRYYSQRQNQLLVSVTEKRTREEINGFANSLEAVLWN